MPSALIDNDSLVEAGRDALSNARRLHPAADGDELLELTFASLAALAPAMPDPWIALALSRLAEQEF